jgi:hypothetical protein
LGRNTHKVPRFDGTELELEFKPIAIRLRRRDLLRPVPVDLSRSRVLRRDRIDRRRRPAGRSAALHHADAPGGRLPYGLEYNVGAGFGLTRGSDDIVTKVNIEFEKFVGRLFG